MRLERRLSRLEESAPLLGSRFTYQPRILEGEDLDRVIEAMLELGGEVGSGLLDEELWTDIRTRLLPAGENAMEPGEASE